LTTKASFLDLPVQRRRDKAAAVKLMRKLVKKQGFAPDVLVTDKLRSYGAAKSEMVEANIARPDLVELANPVHVVRPRPRRRETASPAPPRRGRDRQAEELQGAGPDRRLLHQPQDGPRASQDRGSCNSLHRNG
jgi:hypothetical protein